MLQKVDSVRHYVDEDSEEVHDVDVVVVDYEGGKHHPTK